MSKHIYQFIQRALFGNSADEGQASAMSVDAPDAPPWVLHVEDDVLFSAALKTRLESHGVAVIRAFDGADGMNNAFQYPADAIILDVEMPNGSGDEVLRMLKESESTKHIPVILLTCRKDRGFQQKMLELGASAYLNKPLDFAALQSELSKHISILEKAAV